MSSESNFSTNVRLGASGLQLTVRADDAETFEANIVQAIAKIPALLALEEAARNTAAPSEQQAVANVVNAFNGTVVAAPAIPAAPAAPAAAPQPAFAPVPPQQPVAPAPQAAAAAPSCAHGPMKLVPGGISKKTGKPYNAFWACQWPNRDEQCPANFN